jgi:hypothetical protein
MTGKVLCRRLEARALVDVVRTNRKSTLHCLCLCDNLQGKDEGGEPTVAISIPEAPSVRPIRLNNHRDAL